MSPQHPAIILTQRMRRSLYVIALALIFVIVAFSRSLTPGADDSAPVVAVVDSENTTPRPLLRILSDAVTPAGAIDGAAADSGSNPDGDAVAAKAPAAESATVNRSVDAGVIGVTDLDLTRALRPSFVGDLNAFIQATRYVLAIEIDTERRVISGEQRVRYTNRDAVALDDLVFRLYPNTAHMGGLMTVRAAAINGAPVSTENGYGAVRDGSAIRLVLPAPLQRGESVDVTLQYTIEVPLNPRTNYAIFGEVDGIFSLPGLYAQIPPRDAQGRWRAEPLPAYGDIVLGETALFMARIRVPADFKLAVTGVCNDFADGANHREYDCVAAPARDFAVHMSRNYWIAEATVPTTNDESIIVRSFYLPQDERHGKRALAYAADALKTYEARFAPYPYRVLNVFQSTTPIGGIEYPMAVGVTVVRNDEVYYEWLVAHEVAHQWWYGLVGNDPVNEAWLDEALAQYSTILYVEAVDGERAARDRKQRFFTERWRREQRERGDTRVGQPTGEFMRWAYAPIVYGKGPLFFDAVRKQVGDAAFGQWLKSYFAAKRYGIATGEDLLAAADAAGIGSQVRAAHAQWIAQ